MRYVQSGFRVTITRFFGSICIAGISACLLLYGVGIWFSITEGNTMDSLVASTFFYLLFIAGMTIFAVYNFWKFPDIVTSDAGIDLKVFFYTLHIDWQSIVRMQKKNNGLLIFLRSSGLLLNRLYGMFDAKVWDQPVLLFDSTEEMVKQLEEEIKSHMV
jgi:uncharacterized membrane protein YobD (UPF0266 family)